MSVPAHDERDFEFAKKFDLPIIQVVRPDDPELAKEAATERLCFSGDGTAINSGQFDGLSTPEFKKKITMWLQEQGLGQKAVNYKLRDWLFSRQRYWGEPFPILHAEDGRVFAMDESELPLGLPEVADYKPTGTGEPPLAKAQDWVHVTLPDGSKARRETNTMPQWAGSCWYYLRYTDPKNAAAAFDPEKEKYWLPVDLYIGGAEHAVLHLLYSRFWHKVLFDRGHVSTMEPFKKLVNQGMILSVTYRNSEGRIVPYRQIRFEEGKAFDAETGAELTGETEKMSKSRGNVIPVDVPIQRYGSDTTRLYEMFMGPLESTKPWSMQGVEGVSRFLNRSWRMIVDEESDALRLNERVRPGAAPDREELRVLHKTIQAVTQDMESLSFNTAISRLMEFVNFFTGRKERPLECMESFVLMLAPMAPHIAEEMWRALGHEQSLAYAPWPSFEPKYTEESVVDVPVQVNGKVRGRIQVDAQATREQMEQAALGDPRIRKHLEGTTVRKVIAIPGKLVNIVAG